MTGFFNDSLNDFVGLDAEDRTVLEQIVAKCPERLAVRQLETFDHWLDRMAAAKYIVVVPPSERDARVLHAAGLASLAGKPVIRHRPEPEAAPTARAKTLAEYLEQRGETREKAEARIRERMGEPGRDRHYDKSVTGDGRPIDVGPLDHPSRGHVR